MRAAAAVAAAMALLLGCVAVPPTAALRILSISTVQSFSHFIWATALTDALLERGHHLVEFTFVAPKVHANRTSFVVGKVLGDTDVLADLENIANLGFIGSASLYYNFGLLNNEISLASKDAQRLKEYLRNNTDPFDVMLFDYVIEEAELGFWKLAGSPPLVLTSAYNNPVEVMQVIGSAPLPSLVPHDTMPALGRLTFLERIQNLLVYLLFETVRNWYYLPKVEKLAKEAFGQDLPSLREIESNAHIAIVNSHPLLHGATLNAPSVIEAGCLQAKPAEPLPKDLQNWLDDAEHGFILMSFGSLMRGSNMKPERRQEVIKAFASLKQRVIWKFEADDIIKDLPPNVRVSKWLPQNDILGHPNIRLFISHCGGLSTQEASYHGVPILGVPFIVDQFVNAERLERLGTARTLPYKDLKAVRLTAEVTEMLGNPKYMENARYLSRVLRDQKESPLERAVWWVEYVARHGGAPHLRSPARSLAWYQLLLLDVLAVLILAFGAVLIVVRVVFRGALRLLVPASTQLHAKRD